MNRHLILVTAIAAGSGLLLLAGCEDADARERANVQQSIHDAAAEYRAARHAEPDEMVSQLQAVATRLNQVRGDGGQAQAVAMLQASVNRDLAEHRLSLAMDIERQHRAARAAMIDVVEVVNRLIGHAQGHMQVDFSRSQQELRVQEQDRRQQRQQAESHADEIERPLNDLRAANEADESRTFDLRRQEREAITTANELGPADGFEHYQRGIEFRQEADALEVQVARREIEIATLEDQYERASRRAALQGELAQTLVASQERLNSIAGDLQQEGRLTRDLAESLGQHIADMLAIVRDDNDSGGRLASLYTEARDAMEQAASRTRAAGNSDAARTLSARIDQLRGQLNAMRADALADHAILLDRMIAAGDLFGRVGDLRSEREQTLSSRETALADAIDAYTAASDAFSSGRDGERTAAALQSIVQRLENEPLDPVTVAASAPVQVDMPDDMPAFDPSDFEMPEGMPGGAMNIEPWPLGAGADSPQAVHDAMVAAADDGPKAMFEFVRGHLNMQTVPEPLFAIGDVLVNVVDAVDRLQNAVEQQFGPDAFGELMAAIGSDGGGAVDLDMGDLSVPDDLRVGETVGDQSSLEYTNPDTGEAESMPLVRIDGRWYLTIPDDVVAEMQEDLNPAEIMPMMMMVEAVAGQAVAMIDTFATRVGAGEFQSVDDVAGAISAAVEEAVGGMFGPMMGDSEPGMEFDMEGGDLPPGFPRDMAPDK